MWGLGLHTNTGDPIEHGGPWPSCSLYESEMMKETNFTYMDFTAHFFINDSVCLGFLIFCNLNKFSFNHIVKMKWEMIIMQRDKVSVIEKFQKERGQRKYESGGQRWKQQRFLAIGELNYQWTAQCYNSFCKYLVSCEPLIVLSEVDFYGMPVHYVYLNRTHRMNRRFQKNQTLLKDHVWIWQIIDHFSGIAVCLLQKNAACIFIILGKLYYTSVMCIFNYHFICEYFWFAENKFA